MIRKLITYILLFTASALAQNYYDSVNVIKNEYKTFNYVEVIRRSNDILLKKNHVPQTLIKDVYLLKGSSHYALREDTLAKFSFIEILRIDSTYSPDSVSTSPKIIRFFSEVKNAFISKLETGAIESVPDSLEMIKRYDELYDLRLDQLKNSLYRSFIFPGLGHLYVNDKTGWYLLSAGTIALASSVYFIIDSDNKRYAYMNENDPDEMNSKYNDYNLSYKLRNISLIAYGAIWLFSQIDLISSIENIRINDQDMQVFLQPGYLNLSFRINL